MPIDGKRLSAGIYYEAWIGDIQAQDVYDSAKTRAQWAREDQSDHCYTIIIDGQKCGKLPPMSSLVNASNAHPPNSLEFVVINLPPFPRIIAQMFGRFARHPLRTASSLDEAIAFAEVRLQKATP